MSPADIVVLLVLPLPFLGFILSPPKRRPDGVMYWIALSAVLLFLGFIIGRLFMLILQGLKLPSGEKLKVGGFCVLFLAVMLGLLANTFWAKGMARKLPEGMDEEDRREAMRKLSRRLWWPLLVIEVLLIALPNICKLPMIPL